MTMRDLWLVKLIAQSNFFFKNKNIYCHDCTLADDDNNENCKKSNILRTEEFFWDIKINLKIIYGALFIISHFMI